MRVYRSSYRDRSGQSRSTKKWYVEFRDQNKVTRRWPAFTDKAASLELVRKLHALVNCRISGDQPDPTLAQWLETIPTKLREQMAAIELLDSRRYAAARPLSDHIEDYETALNAKGRNAKYIRTTIAHINRVKDECKFVHWSDITASGVENALAKLRDADKGAISLQTSNYYLQSFKGFAAWMVSDRRAIDSPLKHLKKLNTSLDHKRERRALSEDEVAALLEQTRTEPQRYGMTGNERAMLYQLAIETGLRASELRSLTRFSFALDGDSPTVTVEAGYSKRRRKDTLPLRRDTAEALRPILTTKLAEALAFNVPPSTHTAEMLREDLAAADVGKPDASGRLVDFHALRHTTGSWLSARGVHPKVIQRIMRHSNITLTMDRYTHLFKGDEAEAVEQLPNLSAAAEKNMRITGTDGRQTRATRNDDAQPAKQGDARWARCWAQSVRKHDSDDDTMRQDRDDDDASKSSVRKEKPGFPGNGRGRIRTYVGVSQQIYSLPRLAASVHTRCKPYKI